MSALLHALWHAAWLASGRPVATSLRPAAHELARAARDAGMAPEQFVAAVKASWRADPRVRGATDQVEIRERLAVVVTVCIQEFYEE